ncbi:MAG TPA: hypothetical protein VK936_12685 [Longimicrobiales bacterium]|nr:hypothetical protein [Longimicrobiales bacterium]
MLDDWKTAWREAVENFRREVHEGTPGSPPRVRAMEREVISAAGALAKLDDEIRRTRREAATEAESLEVCRRREAMAREVDDAETVRVAAQFAARHAERQDLLRRKVGVLEEERTLLARDIESMRAMIAEAAPVAGSSAGTVGEGQGRFAPDAGAQHDREFSRMERDARERAADQRLEELKRRMGQ